MKRLIISISLMALFCVGCEQIIGLDDYKVDENTISGDGDDCFVVLYGVAQMDGYCLPNTAEPSECPGGTFPQDPKGTCPGDQLKCCIDTDQCQRYFPATHCADECDADSDEEGLPLGCPAGKMCCTDWEMF